MARKEIIPTSLTDCWNIVRAGDSKRDECKNALLFVLKEVQKLKDRLELAEPILGVIEQIADRKAEDMADRLRDER